MSFRVLVVGGAGEMGRWYARFLSDAGWEVFIHDPRPDALHIAREGGWELVTVLDDLSGFDVVLVSVPIDAVADAVETVAPAMREGSLLCDLTSVKVEPVKVMESCAPAGVDVVGMHPLFGPTMQDAGGQTVILTPVEGRSETWIPRLERLYETAGVRVEIVTPREHDHIMSVVQGLTHFVYIAMGGTMRNLGFDVSGSRRFTSPIYDIFLDVIGRILAQDPRLYALIQTNLDLRNVHGAFAEECRRLADMVDANDKDGVEEYIRAAREHFGDVDGALKRSDSLVVHRIEEMKTVQDSPAPGRSDDRNGKKET